MGKILRLLSAYCFLLSSLLVGCRTAQQVAYSAPAGGGDEAKPKFVPEMRMATHNKKALTANIVEIKKSFGDVSAAPTEPTTKTKKPAGKKSAKKAAATTVIVKRYAVETKDTMPAVAVNQPDTTQRISEPEHDEAGETDAIGIDEAAPVNDEEMDTLVSKYAAMISVDPKRIANYPLYLFIDEWYGTRYKFGGMDNNGIDCSAFSQKLYGEIYRLDLMRTVRQQHRTCKRIKFSDDANEGDLIFFRIHRLRISHVGVYLANGYFVHASRSRGIVISNLNNKYWHRRFAGCGRMEREAMTESAYIP